MLLTLRLTSNIRRSTTCDYYIHKNVHFWSYWIFLLTNLFYAFHALLHLYFFKVYVAFLFFFLFFLCTYLFIIIFIFIHHLLFTIHLSPYTPTKRKLFVFVLQLKCATYWPAPGSGGETHICLGLLCMQKIIYNIPTVLVMQICVHFRSLKHEHTRRPMHPSIAEML